MISCDLLSLIARDISDIQPLMAINCKPLVVPVLDAYPSECACGEGTALWCKERGLIAVPQNVSDDVTKM